MATITNYQWTNRPVLGRTAGTNPAAPAQTVTPQEILLGGFSGLFFEGTTPQGNLRFVTHPDRGPNGEPTNLLPNVPGNERPFALPNFQAEIVRFELNPTSGAITIVNRLPLTRQDGTTPITGLPNLQAGAQGSPYTDEVPIDLWGNRLNNDPLGADLEGIVVAPNGTFWLVDEYRPAIYNFSANGRLIDRFVPAGTSAAVNATPGTFGTEALPAVYAQRRANRGFEAVALDGNKLYAFIQSAIDNPAVANNNTFSLHETEAGFEWRLDKTPDNLAQVNKDFLYLFNRYYLPNFAVYEMTPYGSLMKSIEQDFKYLNPKLELLVPEIVHGEGVPKGAII